MRFTRGFAGWVSLGIAGTALLLAAPKPASAAADVSKEIGTAATHAGYASKGTDMKTVQMHLHHVVNCMVGPKGDGFDQSQANPCKDSGDGVMADYQGTEANRQKLQQALDASRDGLKATKLEIAQKDASTAEALLDNLQ